MSRSAVALASTVTKPSIDPAAPNGFPTAEALLAEFDDEAELDALAFASEVLAHPVLEPAPVPAPVRSRVWRSIAEVRNFLMPSARAQRSEARE